MDKNENGKFRPERVKNIRHLSFIYNSRIHYCSNTFVVVCQIVLIIIILKYCFSQPTSETELRTYKCNNICRPKIYQLLHGVILRNELKVIKFVMLQTCFKNIFFNDKLFCYKSYSPVYINTLFVSCTSVPVRLAMGKLINGHLGNYVTL